MNEKAAKLIRQYARMVDTPIAELRERWTNTPRPKRGPFRAMMKRAVAKRRLQEKRK